ncbi:MAG: hypothetical protein M3N25_04950 [Actinomycetota bacterium]|nr:hypothetical protein [Actinomycetota bacterium]
MDRFVVRVELPDRPGALGLVASRVGAVRGEIVGIDILECAAGRAVDELVVELPDSSLLELLVGEVTAVDGVEVDDVRPVPSGGRDPRLDALETAVHLTEATSIDTLLESLVVSAQRALQADLAVVEDESPIPPALEDDVARVSMPSAGVALVLRRAGRRFRSRELAQLSALARIADVRWRELSGRAATDGRDHPQ